MQSRQLCIDHLETHVQGHRAPPGVWTWATGGPMGSSDVLRCGQHPPQVHTGSRRLSQRFCPRSRCSPGPRCQVVSGDLKEETPMMAVLRSSTLFSFPSQCHKSKLDLQVGILWKVMTNFGSDNGMRREKKQPGNCTETP